MTTSSTKDELVEEAKAWLEQMREHTDCCGTPIVRRLVAALSQTHSGGDGEKTAARGLEERNNIRAAAFEEALRAVVAISQKCDEDFFAVNGSIYAEAYIDGNVEASDAIRAILSSSEAAPPSLLQSSKLGG